MQIDQEAVHAVIVGELDMSNVREIAASLERTCAGTRALTLDIARVTFVDGHAITELYRLNGHLLQMGRKLRVITDPATSVARVLDLSGLNLVLKIEQHSGRSNGC